MKIFFSGSDMAFSVEGKLKDSIENVCDSKNEIIIEDTLKGDLNMQKYLAEKGYEKVRIFCMRESSEYEEWPRRNEGNWPYRVFFRRQYDYDFNPIVECEAAKECEKSIFVWDGKNIEQFSKMLIFLASGKECEIHILDDGIVMNINDISDLASLIKKDNNSENYKEIFSKERLSIRELYGNGLLPVGYFKEFPKELHASDTYYSKTELENKICRGCFTLAEKERVFSELARADNLYEELIRRVRAIKGSKNMDELRMIIMDTVEHSFQHSYDVIAEVNRWINKAEYSSGSNNIVLYLFERFKKNGEVSEDPIGMYDCIDNAIDYIKWSCRESRGARIELWEKEPKGNFQHIYNLYTKYDKIVWFESMRIADLIDEFDLFEPITYWSKNRHYLAPSILAR